MMNFFRRKKRLSKDKELMVQRAVDKMLEIDDKETIDRLTLEYQLEAWSEIIKEFKTIQ